MHQARFLAHVIRGSESHLLTPILSSSSCEHSHSGGGISISKVVNTANQFVMGGSPGTAGAVDTGYPTLSEHPVGQKIESIYQGRLRQFTAKGQFESETLRRYEFSILGETFL